MRIVLYFNVSQSSHVRKIKRAGSANAGADTVGTKRQGSGTETSKIHKKTKSSGKMETQDNGVEKVQSKPPSHPNPFSTNK
jgi:hypothetical protein